MKLQIPIGSSVGTIGNNKIIRIQVPNTKYWVQGEKKLRNIWDLFLIDPESTYKELIKANMTTKAFIVLTNVVLKSPFPYTGKRAQDSKIIKKFVNQLIK